MEMIREQSYNSKHKVSVPTEESLAVLIREQKERCEMTELDFSSNYVVFMNQAIKFRDLMSFLDGGHKTDEVNFSSREFVRSLRKTLLKQSSVQKLSLCFERDMDNSMMKIIKDTLPKCSTLKHILLNFQRCEKVNINVIIDFLHSLLPRCNLRQIEFSCNISSIDDDSETHFLRIKKLLQKYFKHLNITFRYEVQDTKTCIFSGSQKSTHAYH